MQVATLLRMSSDEQNLSIEEQRIAIQAYCRRQGHEVVAEYLDEGKSGSKHQERRLDFKRLLKDSASGKFQAVICYNTSRFARLDSLDGAEAKKTLRGNGVHLETVREGVIDWNTSTGRIIDTIHAEKDHAYSRDLSDLTVRGRVHLAREGFWAAGSIPYGFDRLYVDEEGTSHLVPRTQRGNKPRKWRLKLVANQDEEPTIKWIFDQYDAHGKSLHALALELNQRAVPAPTNRGRGHGKGWDKSNIKLILTNPVYCGTYHFGVRRKRDKEAFNRAAPILIPNAIPAMVSQEVWDRVQLQLEAKADQGWFQSQRSSPLSGILKCGHCGYRMDKKVSRKGEVYFSCGGNPKKTHKGCRQWRVHEAAMLTLITEGLVARVDSAVLASLQARPQEQDQEEEGRLTKEVTRLAREVETANSRYVSPNTPDDLLPMVATRIKALKFELGEVTRKLTELRSSGKEVGDFTRWWQSVKGKLVTVAGIKWETQSRTVVEGVPGVEVTRAFEFPVAPAIMIEGDVFREVLRKLGVKVTLFWKPRAAPQGTRYSLDMARVKIEWGSGSVCDNLVAHSIMRNQIVTLFSLLAG